MVQTDFDPSGNRGYVPPIPPTPEGGGGVALAAPIGPQPNTSDLGTRVGQEAPTPHPGYTSYAAAVFGIERQGASSDAIRTMELAAADEMNRDPDPTRLLNLRVWSTVAPTLGGAVHLSLAQAGIGPQSALGQWLIRSGVPALAEKSDWKPPDIQNMFALLSDPERLGQLQQLPMDQQSNLFKHGPWNVGKLTDAQLQHLAQTGNLPDPGWRGYIGDITRPAFAALAAPLEMTVATARQMAGQELAALRDLKKGDYISAAEHAYVIGSGAAVPTSGVALEKAGIGTHGPLETETWTGAKIKIGGSEQTTDITGQTELGQALLHGKNLGAGIFPGGTAMEQAVLAQKVAATVNGHAMTPGRALASFVTTPGELPYQLMSGTIDFGVALEADPSALMLGQLGDLRKASKLFAIPTETAIAATADHVIDIMHGGNAEAIRSWLIPDLLEKYQGAISRRAVATTGLRDALIEKLTKNPGSLQELVGKGILTPEEVTNAIASHHAGMLGGLSRRISPKDALEFLNSPFATKQIQRMVKMTGTEIHLKSNIPAEIAWKLGDAGTEDAVRAVYAEAIGSADLRSVPHLQTSTRLPVGKAQPYTWTHPFQDLRWNANLPNWFADVNDPRDLVRRAIADLQLGKVPKAEWDTYLRRIATAGGNEIDIHNGFMDIGNRIGQEVLKRDSGYQKNLARLADLQAEHPDVEVPEMNSLRGRIQGAEDFAKRLTTYYTKTGREDRASWTTIMGEKPSVQGLAADGSTMPINSVYLPTELVNRGVVPPLGGARKHLITNVDAGEAARYAGGIEGLREIKRNVSMWHDVWHAPIIGTGLRDGMYLWDKFTEFNKALWLLKGSLPVRFLADEQLRGATAGVGSFFKTPFSYMNMVIAGKEHPDTSGKTLLDLMSEHQSAYKRAVGESGQWMQELRGSEQLYSRGWRTITQDMAEYTDTWADRLSQAHIDPTSRAAVRAVVDPEKYGMNLDDVKQSFFDGELSGERESLVNADVGGWGGNLVNRAQSDAYIDGVVQRAQDMAAGGRDDLMHAIASGDPWNAGTLGDGNFRKLLTQLNNERVSPLEMNARMDIKTELQGPLRRASNAMFSVLMSWPTKELTRSPMFKEFMVQRIEELMPHMQAETRDALIEAAKKWKITLRPGPTGLAVHTPLTLEHVEYLAKDFALQSMHRYLYYPGMKTNAVDVLRNIIPFGNAWKSVLTSWAKLAAENPKVIRRVQQGVTDARRSGWWFVDPVDGEEKFTIVPAGLMKHLSGVPFPMVAPVKGLNIGMGLPGVGPVVQWGAAPLLGQFHGNAIADKIGEMIYPYGTPDMTAGGVLNSLLPGWAEKLQATGFLAAYPLGQGSKEQERIFNNVVNQAYAYEMSTGKYNWHDTDVVQKVWAKAKVIAEKMYMWRSLAQNAVPAAPQYLATAKLPDGGLIEQWVLAQDLRKIEAATGDPNEAMLQFVDKYGADLIFAAQPMTKTQVYGIPTTAQSEEWRNAHPTFAAQYDKIYGYWAPSGGNFDRGSYLAKIARGEIEPLTGHEWSDLATTRLGNAVYSQVRSKLPPSLSLEEKAGLDDYKKKLALFYPGFMEQTYNTLDINAVIEGAHGLKRAVLNKAVRNTPLSHALVLYLDARDQAMSAARERGLMTLGGDGARDIADALFAYGTQVAQQMPEFTSIWDGLLQREVDNNG